MAQINLLKQSKPSDFQSKGLMSILSKLAIVGLLALAAFYGWTLFRLKNTEAQARSLEKDIITQRQKLSQIAQRDEILTRQAQIKELDQLINNHVYWSQLLPELAKVTLKKASYLSLSAEKAGSLRLTVQVPTMEDLDKFFQVFDTLKINRYFSGLSIGGISKVQEENQSYIRVDVQLKYDPTLLKYKEQN